MTPTLIHPVPVHLQQAVRSATKMDPVAREPVHQMWKTGQGPGLGDAVVLEAQVSWNTAENFRGRSELRPGGVDEESQGYFLVRYADLLAAGIATMNSDGTISPGIARGDRIVRIGTTTVTLYVNYFRDVAFYPEEGGATLLEVRFTDRAP